ncbi:Uncharacterized conserved protein [Devosia lucknowensis]|uniref:Uncharacterized conserved protein n=1 Tax=Devosia lucknowensis TaxID=1096929 RepID=A0A1Y6G9K6_9HYPH|nr:hypothetical protein [Devosia lucknowensis]SMQ86063.1 Uncharacterized conserved protein [Devosia lucknowensis]
MAEQTGNETPASATKASAAKTGPVKPPVLEGTARPASSSKPADPPKPAEKSAAEKPAGKAAELPPVTKPKVDEPKADGNGRAWIAGISGGIIGLGAAYALASLGLWPATPQTAAPADPRLAQFATAIPNLETATGTVQDDLVTLTSRVASLETALREAPAAEPTGTDPALAEQIDALSARIDALAEAQPQGTTSPEALSAIENELATLRTEGTNTATQLAETQQQLATLTQSTTETAGADAAAVRLPLIFSGLESAFGSGRGFETELAALRQALPETLVPEAVAGRAASGLPRPESIASRLNAALPDMLAGRPATADVGWQDATADWFRGVIAMRPAGAVEGNTPDATIARLEDAVARRDFASAEAEINALPEPMRRAAGELPADISSLAAAQTFLAELRQSVLNAGGGA